MGEPEYKLPLHIHCCELFFIHQHIQMYLLLLEACFLLNFKYTTQRRYGFLLWFTITENWTGFL